MWDNLQNFLAIIGIVSIAVTILRIFWTLFCSSEWIDNVKIEEYDMNIYPEGENHWFPEYYPYFQDDNAVENHATKNFFIPENTIINKVKLKKLIDLNFENGKEKYETIHTFKSISPDKPICLIIERAETIPQYLIEWRTQYGGRARYYFCENLRDENNNERGFEYKYGPVSKVRKILDLK